MGAAVVYGRPRDSRSRFDSWRGISTDRGAGPVAPDRAPAVTLRLIQGAAREARQGMCARRVLEVADPDRDGDARTRSREIDAHPTMGPPRHRLGRIGCGLGEQDGELVAPDPRHEIGSPRDGVQPSGNRSHDRIANPMAEVIVHVLQPVDVQARKRERTTVSLCMLDLGSQPVVERATVREAGQRVGIRLALELRAHKHDLVVSDPRVEVMFAPARAIPRRVLDVRLRYVKHRGLGY